MNPTDVVLISGAFTFIGTLLAWILARRDKKDERGFTVQTPTPPSTQEVWVRLDATERVADSAVILLGKAADHWPEGVAPPIFPKRHVLVLAEEGKMPPKWDPLVE